MSTTAADLRHGSVGGATRGSLLSEARAYFASDLSRKIQTVLGLIWLLDGGLQFQSFMYGKGFVQLLAGNAAGQPNWVSSSVIWGAHRLAASQDLFNTLFALVQVTIGIGLLHRPAVKPALVLSFFWAPAVWWFGEAFGRVFMATTGVAGAPVSNALTGAPGAVLLYVLVGASVWPNGRPGGLLGQRGLRRTWGVLWLLMAYLWVTPPSTTQKGITNAIHAAPSGTSWLSSVQNWVAKGASGNGEWIAILLALLSAAIALAVLLDWRPREFLIVAIVLSLAYWVVGEGFGGIFADGATDPNSGPLWVLLACSVYAVLPAKRPGCGRALIEHNLDLIHQPERLPGICRLTE
jgi:hypothetical protein